MIDKETGEEWHFEHLRSAEEAYEYLCAENDILKQNVWDLVGIILGCDTYDALRWSLIVHRARAIKRQIHG